MAYLVAFIDAENWMSRTRFRNNGKIKKNNFRKCKITFSNGCQIFPIILIFKSFDIQRTIFCIFYKITFNLLRKND